LAWLSHPTARPASTEVDGTVRLWNFATREIALTLKGHVGYVSPDLSFSRNGKYLATSGADGTVRLWEAASPEEIPSPRAMPGSRSSVWAYVQIAPASAQRCG
jgi:WD40 repeat protein